MSLRGVIIDKFYKTIAIEINNIYPWLVVAFGISVICKFIYYDIYDLKILICLFSGLLFCYKISNTITVYHLIRFLFFIILGNAAVIIKLSYTDQKTLKRQIKETIISGKCTEIRLNNKGAMLTLTKVQSSEYSELNNRNIRLFVNNDDYEIISRINYGDFITCRATLYRDRYSRPFYYKYYDIYAYGKLIKLSNTVDSINNVGIIKFIDQFRRSIQKKIFNINNRSSGAGIVIAILTGNTGFINKHDLENIRKTGCAHILAISGLHMSIVMTFIFQICKLIFKFLPYIILRYNIIEISKMISLLLCFFYLQLSGSPISAKRSFVMLFFSILISLLNRPKSSYNILCTAALIILVPNPEFIFLPSFQMSFIAVLSLISTYGYTQGILKIKDNTNNGTRKALAIIRYVLSICLSSVAATFATSFYEIYHFKQYALIGIATNLLVIPLTEFFALPIAFTGMLLHYTSISRILYQVSAIIGEVICVITEWAKQIPYSYFTMKEMSNETIAMISLGLIVFFLAQTRLKFLGLFLITISIVIYIK